MDKVAGQKRLVFATNVYIDDYGNFTLVKADSRIIGEYPTKERACRCLTRYRHVSQAAQQRHTKAKLAHGGKVEKYGVVYIMP